jgi:hypothetical protein
LAFHARTPALIIALALLAPTPAALATDPPPPTQTGPAPTAKTAKSPTSLSAMSASDYAACLSDLTASKVVFEQRNTAKQEGCELSGAVRLSIVATRFGDVALTGTPTLLCSFGRQFSGWVRDVAAPLALGYTGRRLAAIETGSAFDCRARNDKPGAVPSEHAKGDAIDIASIVLSDNQRVRVKEDPSEIPAARDLMRALRMTACGYFTTVLGPGSDAAHAEHLHFDSGIHGATPNYRICE